jgi:hypothetical protein
MMDIVLHEVGLSFIFFLVSFILVNLFELVLYPFIIYDSQTDFRNPSIVSTLVLQIGNVIFVLSGSAINVGLVSVVALLD